MNQTVHNARVAGKRAHLADVRKAMGIPLQRSRPSTTRSDALSQALHDAGFGVDRLVADLEALSNATVPVRLVCRLQDGTYVEHKTIDIPDSRTRLLAAKMLLEVHGWLYQPQKAQDQPIIVQILNQLPAEVREPVETQLVNRLKAFLPQGGT